jgi:hypothetical protein
MSEENMETEKSKSEKIYDSMKDLDVIEVVSKKSSIIKDVEKNLKLMALLDVTKGAERSKLGKMMDKTQDLLLSISIADKVLKEKDF